jgi:hypothetical protein
MKLYLLSLLFLWNAGSTKTPNFYPSYVAAREASKNYQKDLLIFFSKQSCSQCDAAWATFEKDQLGTKIFISTMIDAQDFDGAVLLDKYGLNSAPSWLILDYEGNVKQKWAGDWKNPHVRPDPNAPVAESKPEAKPIPVFKATTATQPAPKPAVAETPAPAPVAVTEKPAPPVTPVEPKTETMVAGYVLQAGYFGSEANAQKLVNDLIAKGYEKYMIKTTVQNGTTFYRVVSPGYTTEAEAAQVVEALSGSGIKATIKKTTEI